MSYRKKLIEVALPLEAINRESAREKSIRHGHPSTLHLWWARRPLAACRAVLFSSIVDDPSSRPEEVTASSASRPPRRGPVGRSSSGFWIWVSGQVPSGRALDARLRARRVVALRTRPR